MKIKEFYLEESKVNKQCMILIAVDENNQKWVVSGNSWHPNYCIEYEVSFDTKQS